MANAQLDSDIDYCVAKYLYGTYTEYVRCTNQVATTYFKNVDFPYPEITPLSNSYNLALAERVDAGYLTREQALRISRLIRNELIHDAIHRERQITEQHAAWQQLVSSLNSLYLYNRPINCMRMGNMITCN